MQSFANILNMKYYYSDQAQSPFIEVEGKDDLIKYPEKMWWESEDGIVLTMITEIQ